VRQTFDSRRRTQKLFLLDWRRPQRARDIPLMRLFHGKLARLRQFPLSFTADFHDAVSNGTCDTLPTIGGTEAVSGSIHAIEHVENRDAAPDSTVRDTSSLPFDWCEIHGETCSLPFQQIFRSLSLTRASRTVVSSATVSYLGRSACLWRPHKHANEGRKIGARSRSSLDFRVSRRTRGGKAWSPLSHPARYLGTG
jgi:hypothetical protein